MRILFLTDNFPPEVNAPASRTYEHCREWAKKGCDVTVITCVPNFPKGKVFEGYRNKLWQKEVIDGIKVIRVWSYIVPNKGFLKRTLDYISFSVTSFLAGLFVKTDVIIATSPQFFTALSGRVLAKWKRKPWIMEVRDLWPESIKAVGALKDNLFIRYFEWQEKRCYRSANKIVVVTDTFKREIEKKGISPDKIHVVKNGVNKELFKPTSKDHQLIDDLGIEGKFIVGYIGTHGMAHKLDFILDCAKALDNKDNNYHFLFIGDGAKKEELQAYNKQLGCSNVTMLDSVSKSEVSRYISILDVCLINLRKSPLFTTVIPSKIFENAGMGIPILLGVEGEAKDIIESYDAGMTYEPENQTDFIEKLKEISISQNLQRFKEGCLRLSADYDRTRLASDMLDIITHV
jgi:hypothetical protein